MNQLLAVAAITVSFVTACPVSAGSLINRKSEQSIANFREQNYAEIASAKVELKTRSLIVTKDGVAQMTLSGPRGTFTMNKSDSLEIWSNYMNSFDFEEFELTRTNKITILKGYRMEGEFGSKVVIDLDDHYLGSFTFIYNYMKDKKGY